MRQPRLLAVETEEAEKITSDRTKAGREREGRGDRIMIPEEVDSREAGLPLLQVQLREL